MITEFRFETRFVGILAGILICLSPMLGVAAQTTNMKDPVTLESFVDQTRSTFERRERIDAGWSMVEHVESMSVEERSRVTEGVLDQIADLLDDPEDGMVSVSAIVLGKFGAQASRYVPRMEAALRRLKESRPTMYIVTGPGAEDAIQTAIPRILVAQVPQAADDQIRISASEQMVRYFKQLSERDLAIMREERLDDLAGLLRDSNGVLVGDAAFTLALFGSRAQIYVPQLEQALLRFDQTSGPRSAATGMRASDAIRAAIEKLNENPN